MAWEITVGERTARIEVEDIEHGYQLVIDGEPVKVWASFPERGLLRMVHWGRSHSVDVRASEIGQEVEVGGIRIDASVIDERDKAMRTLHAGAAGAGGGEVISTSMPGKVVALLVELGEVVKAGQGIVVIEAMKMENELKAKHEGVIERIPVSIGQAVEGGAELVVIGPPARDA